MLIKSREEQAPRAQPASKDSEALRKSRDPIPIGQQFLESIDKKERWQRDLVATILNQNDPLWDSLEPSALDERSSEWFLDNLAYPEMYVRESQVSQAFNETFKWLFEPSHEQASWTGFQAWLADAEAENTYWISGKPGSGKSTLVKFIANEEQTNQQLQEWAQGNTLVRACFYFWSAGSRLYKTREGLLRSLLFQIFREHGDMTTLYCPRRAQVHRLFGSYPLPWTIDELEEAIVKVLQANGTKFFFLIDGLDECAEDHDDLVRFMRHLTEGKNVKMCISSRPWAEFEDSYQDAPHLKVHERTSDGVRHFVQCHLSQSRGFGELRKRDEIFADSLVESIAEKSQGVFLWVQFVVRAILIDLKHGNRIEILRGRLKELPEDLEELFQKLIDMIEDSYKEDAYQIFQLIGAVHTPITLLALSFAHEDGRSSDVSNYPYEPLSRDQIEGRCSQMQRRLMSHCKGLLEVVPVVNEAQSNTSPDGNLDGSAGPARCASSRSHNDEASKVGTHAACTVQYMHRTVKDFLKKRGIWKSFAHIISASSFDPYAALSRASLIGLKTASIETMTTDLFWEAVSNTLHYATLSGVEANTSLAAELDELDRTADKIARMPWPKEPSGNLIKRHMGIPHPHQRVPRRVQGHNEACSHWSAAQAKGGSQHSFLCMAVQFGLSSYVEEKLKSGAQVEQSPRSRSLLDCAVRDHVKLSELPRAPPVGFDQRLSMIKMLLEQGDDPNRVDAYRGTPWMHLEAEIKASLIGASKPARERRYSRVFLPRQAQSTVQRQPALDASKAAFLLSSAELFVKYRASCWGVDIKGVTEALGRVDEQRATALGRAMKTRRLSLSHLWSSSGRRKGQIVVHVVEVSQTSDDDKAWVK